MLEFDYYGAMELSEHMEVYYRLFKRFDEISFVFYFTTFISYYVVRNEYL